MTSDTNARELDRLRGARTAASERFSRQLKLMGLLETTAGELNRVRAKWSAQLVALVELAGNAAVAADVVGLPRADVDAAIKVADRGDVEAVLAATLPRTRHKTVTPAHVSG